MNASTDRLIRAALGFQDASPAALEELHALAVAALVEERTGQDTLEAQMQLIRLDAARSWCFASELRPPKRWRFRRRADAMLREIALLEVDFVAERDRSLEAKIKSERA